MARLPKFTLEKNEKKDRWDMTKDGTHEVVKSFDTKGSATKGDVLEKAVGSAGGSVKIKRKMVASKRSEPIPAARTRRHPKDRRVSKHASTGTAN